MDVHLQPLHQQLPFAVLREDSNNNFLKNSENRRCLFGKSDPVESKRLFEEQMKIDQERFLSRYEITEEDIENLPLITDDKIKKHATVNGTGKSNRNRKTLIPYLRQPRISDFYQSRKSDRCEKILK